MSFDGTYRYFAFAPSLLLEVMTLVGLYGETANAAPGAGGRDLVTLLCGLDNSETGELQAIDLDTTFQALPLTDGRLFAGGYWTGAVIAAFEAGLILGEELTEAQVRALQPISEDI